MDTLSPGPAGPVLPGDLLFKIVSQALLQL
jgi:hypothetical protein